MDPEFKSVLMTEQIKVVAERERASARAQPMIEKIKLESLV